MALYLWLDGSATPTQSDPGKKSPARQVSYDQYSANWDRAFGKKKDQPLREWTLADKAQMN